MQVKQISDNEIYLLIKYIKSLLWRVVKRLSLYRRSAVPKGWMFSSRAKGLMEIDSSSSEDHQIIFSFTAFWHQLIKKLFNLCFKPLRFSNITLSLHCYAHKKDERATPGNIVTKWCPPPRRKIESLTSPITLPFVCSSTVSCVSFSLCLSLSLSYSLLCQPSGWGLYVRNVQWPAFSIISPDISRHWSHFYAGTQIPC